jgi:hypothetical protein
MNAPQGAGPPYEVIFSGSTRNQFKDLCREAAPHGLEKAVLSAARAIIARLRSDPRGFGESLYTLRGMKLEVRIGIELPLVVSYGVHEEKPLVFIRKIFFTPGVG